MGKGRQIVHVGKLGRGPNQPHQPIPSPTYGRTKLSKLRAAVQALRDAIRSGDPEAIEAAWDRCEPWIDRIFVPNEDT